MHCLKGSAGSPNCLSSLAITHIYHAVPSQYVMDVISCEELIPRGPSQGLPRDWMWRTVSRG